MRFFRVALPVLAVLLVFVGGPIWNLASGAAPVIGDWSRASRESAGIAPAASAVPEAIVHVYAARAFAWRGALAVHTWIAVKPSGASHWTTYQVIGWNARRGGKAVAIRREAPDRYWFGNPPVLLVEYRGAGIDAMIDRIDKAARSYPWNDIYRVWPGPNSNTFVAWIARQVPGLGVDLPATAIGKDWLGGATVAAAAPSGTGYQLSLYGVAGLLAAADEGLEVNIAGLTVGVDPLDFALKLPGFGRVGPLPMRAATPVQAESAGRTLGSTGDSG